MHRPLGRSVSAVFIEGSENICNRTLMYTKLLDTVENYVYKYDMMNTVMRILFTGFIAGDETRKTVVADYLPGDHRDPRNGTGPG